MRKSQILAALAASVLCGSAARAVTSIDHEFNSGTVEFSGVYNSNPAGYTTTGGFLTMQTLPGDTYGQYGGPTDPGGADPDTAQNVFYDPIDVTAGTQVDTKVTLSNLNSNFHGGGIWIGTDTDHFLRLGVIHNGNSINIEADRENQDLWTNNQQAYVGGVSTDGGAAEHGPGHDILNDQATVASIPTGTQTTPLTVYLRIIRTGHNAAAYYSLDGSSYIQINADGGSTTSPLFDAISTDATNLGVPGQPSSVEPNPTFKVGVYAIGGGNTPATAAFDYFTANATPEPACLGLIALAGISMIRRRRGA